MPKNMERTLVKALLLTLLLASSGVQASDEANIILLDVNENFDLLTLLESKNFTDTEVHQRFDLGFVRKLLLLRAASPDIGSLRGNELSGLCRLTTYSLKSGLKYASKKDAALTNLALSYANRIDPEVSASVKQVQASLGGDGCVIGGK
jgi:hypothetical protein